MNAQKDERWSDARRDEQWAERVLEELQRRMKTVRFVHRNPDRRPIVRRYLSTSGVDGCIAFARDWAWTLDPRNKPPLTRNTPFVLWERQEALLRAIYDAETNGTNLLVAKSRDTGVTWLLVVYAVWRWLFTPGWVGSFGSRKLELLDRKGDPKTVFAKVRWVIDHLPRWMRPAGYDAKLHDNHTRILNPSNGAVIGGEAGDDQGRGGRSSLYVLDEFGKARDPRSIDAAVSGNSDTVVYIHTATEPGTYFDQLRKSGRVRVFRFSWESDPRKTPAFRQWFLEKYGPDITKREIDIDFTGSGELAFIPSKYVDAAVEADLEAVGPITAGLDIADQGKDATVLAVRRGPVVSPLNVWRKADPVQTAGRAREICVEQGVESLRYDNIGVGAGTGGAFDAMNPAPPFSWTGVNFGARPTQTFYDDAPRLLATERFANLKAELWWALRVRFENTYRRVVLGHEVDASECISIPADEALRAELSSPRREYTTTGLIKVESKASLRKRGVASPDRAESLVYAFADAAANDTLVMVL